MQMKNVCRSYAAHKRGVFSSVVCRIFCEYICLTLLLLLKQGSTGDSVLCSLLSTPAPTLYPLPLSHTLHPLPSTPRPLVLLPKSNTCPVCLLPSVPCSCPLHPMPMRSTPCPLCSNRRPCRASRWALAPVEFPTTATYPILHLCPFPLYRWLPSLPLAALPTPALSTPYPLCPLYSIPPTLIIISYSMTSLNPYI